MFYVFGWDLRDSDDPAFRRFESLEEAKNYGHEIRNAFDHVVITKEIGRAVRSIQMIDE